MAITKPAQPRPPYNAANWYWVIPSIASYVFASARAAWIPASDAAYSTWLTSGGVATSVPDTATLADVLTTAGLTQAATAAAVDPTSLSSIQAGARAQIAATRYALVAGGVTVNGHPFDTSLEARANWDSVYLAALGNPALAIQWKLTSGVFLPLDAAQITAIGQALLGFVQSCFAYEESLLAQINAAATIPAVQAIDLVTGWPSSILTVAGAP